MNLAECRSFGSNTARTWWNFDDLELDVPDLATVQLAAADRDPADIGLSRFKDRL